jgi:hypothetical protein
MDKFSPSRRRGLWPLFAKMTRSRGNVVINEEGKGFPDNELWLKAFPCLPKRAHGTILFQAFNEIFSYSMIVINLEHTRIIQHLMTKDSPWTS